MDNQKHCESCGASLRKYSHRLTPILVKALVNYYRAKNPIASSFNEPTNVVLSRGVNFRSPCGIRVIVLYINMEVKAIPPSR